MHPILQRVRRAARPARNMLSSRGMSRRHVVTVLVATLWTAAGAASAAAQPDGGVLPDDADDQPAEPAAPDDGERAPPPPDDEAPDANRIPVEAAPTPVDETEAGETTPTGETPTDPDGAIEWQDVISASGQAVRPKTPAHFGLGSYGRIAAATDLSGGTPAQISVVAHPPRIVEPSYAELDLYYDFPVELHGGDLSVRTVTTLAFDDTLFHYTGEFDAHIALRNLYVEARRERVTAWVGSRMYRGDDIYLLDFWPLDDINTLGAGLSWKDDGLDLAGHVGVNRLLDPYQFQEREVSDPELGAQTIVQLDRQRLTASVTGRYVITSGRPTVAVKAHAEVQGLPAGERLRADDTVEELPRDAGFLAGAEVSLSRLVGDGANATHVNAFVRWAKGVAAFDELQPLRGFDDTLSTWPNASEIVLGLAGNYEVGRAGVLVGAYARRFIDGDENAADRDDGWEYVADVRPQIAITGPIIAAADLSFQARFPRGLSPTDLLARDPAVFQIAPMLVYSPLGTGSYVRPQIRVVYRAAHLNDGALDLYPFDDPRRDDPWVHYLGVQGEWWFNSTTR